MATLAGKTVVVVGGTSGIGYGVAKASLLSQAAHVIVASSTQSKVDGSVQTLQALITEKKLPGKVSGQVVDARDTEVVKTFAQGLGEIDHFVWTSGTLPGMGGEIPLETLQDGMTLRLWSPVVAVRNLKVKTGGSITFTIGTAVFKPPKGWGAGTSSGGAVEALTRGLAVDLAPIRANVISPGAVETPLWNSLPVEMKEGMLKDLSSKLLVKHVADADEVAEAYLFVMKCGYVTGQTIHVEGGALLI